MKELYKLCIDQPHFRFLIDALHKELQVILIRLNHHGFDIEFQEKILKIFAHLQPEDSHYDNLENLKSDGTRLIQIALILYYLDRNRKNLANYLLDDMINHLIKVKELSKNDIVHIVVDDCKRINETTPTFWEDTDRGNANIYYSPEKNQVTNFVKLFHKKMAQSTERFNGRRSDNTAKELINSVYRPWKAKESLQLLSGNSN